MLEYCDPFIGVVGSCSLWHTFQFVSCPFQLIQYNQFDTEQTNITDTLTQYKAVCSPQITHTWPCQVITYMLSPEGYILPFRHAASATCPHSDMPPFLTLTLTPTMETEVVGVV